MAELKTQVNDADVEAFLAAIPDEQRRKDCQTLAKWMKKITGCAPKMWGDSIVGFGTYHYKSKSGCEGDWYLTGFASRKDSLTVYIMAGFTRYEELMARLGKHKNAKSCLYIKRLSDVDEAVLKELIALSVDQMKTHQKCADGSG
jgi:hypothetical protein